MASKKYEELKTMIVKAHLAKERQKRSEAAFSDEQAAYVGRIFKLMGSMGIDDFEFLTTEDQGQMFAREQMILSCRRVEPKTVEYNAETLYKRLGKKIGNEVVDKTYVIPDMKKMAKFLQGYGVDPKKFKRLIEVRKVVNKQRLENIYETGVIKMEDLEGCFVVKKGKPYLSLRTKSVKQGADND